MTDTKLIHIGKNGPTPCSARKIACRYQHFSTLEEAETAYAEIMLAEGNPSVGGTISKNSAHKETESELSPEMLQVKNQLRILANKKSVEVTTEELKEVGSVIDNEVFNRLGLTQTKEEFSKEELKLIAAMNSTVLKELAEEGEARVAKNYGPFAKQLDEAISVLPASAIAHASADIYTKAINRNNRTYDGYHIAAATVYEEVEEFASSIKVPATAKKGDFFAAGIHDSELDDSTYLGFSIRQVDRPLGEKLKAGENLSPYLQLLPDRSGTEKLLKLVDMGILDDHGRLVEGREKDFEKEAPEFAEVVIGTAVTFPFYVGKKPTGNKGSRYKKVGDSVEIVTAGGKKTLVNKPVYKTTHKKTKWRASTIGVKKDWEDKADPSVLLHEFTHAVQTWGEAPGEGEMFLNLAKKERKETSLYKYYEGFPDEYMGADSGREVFTRATESLFYPSSAGNEFLYSADAENKDEIRTWALGAWALLSNKKPNQR